LSLIYAQKMLLMSVNWTVLLTCLLKMLPTRLLSTGSKKSQNLRMTPQFAPIQTKLNYLKSANVFGSSSFPVRATLYSLYTSKHWLLTQTRLSLNS